MNKASVAGPLAGISQQYNHLRRSEKKVADSILAAPSSCLTLNIKQLALHANVSEPTVMRFCKAIGCSGFQDFKLKLAQDIGASRESQFAEFAVDQEDDSQIIKKKVFNATIQELLTVRDQLSISSLQLAVGALMNASRVEFFGFGASGAVAKDAYHKFIRLQMNTAASSDPHMQLISVSTMKKGDVVVAISQTGRSKELIYSVKQAKKNNVTVIGICPDHTALAEQCDFPLSIEASENTEQFTPLTSRIVHLVVIDVLATCVAMSKEPALSHQLKSIKNGLKSLRLKEVRE